MVKKKENEFFDEKKYKREQLSNFIDLLSASEKARASVRRQPMIVDNKLKQEVGQKAREYEKYATGKNIASVEKNFTVWSRNVSSYSGIVPSFVRDTLLSEAVIEANDAIHAYETDLNYRLYQMEASDLMMIYQNLNDVRREKNNIEQQKRNMYISTIASVGKMLLPKLLF